jgi:hypothetical protein
MSIALRRARVRQSFIGQLDDVGQEDGRHPAPRHLR